MKTRLTKALREEITNSIMAATNFEDRLTKARQKYLPLIREKLITTLPEGFWEATKGMPAEWFEHRVLIDVDFSNYLYQRGKDFKTTEPIRVPTNRKDFGLFANDPLLNEYAELVKTIDEQRDEARAQVESFLLSCRNTDQIVERMPEFERHVPKNGKTYAIVATTANLASALFAAGFDKGLKEAA